VPLAGLQRTDTDDVPRDFSPRSLVIEMDDAILALLVSDRMMNRALDTHRRDAPALGLHAAGIEAQIGAGSRGRY